MLDHALRVWPSTRERLWIVCGAFEIIDFMF